MSELIGQTSDKNLAKNSQLDLDTFKSIYYWQNVKPDTQTKFFRTRKKIEISDIFLLNERLNDKISTQNVETYIASINFMLKDGNLRSYGSWEEFKREKWEFINQTVLSINITWDLTFTIKNFTLPQRHTLKVKLGNSIAPKDMFQMMFTSDEPDEILASQAEGLVKVDFINQMISNELINIVSEWHNGLKSIELGNSYVRFLDKNQKYIINAVSNFTPVLFIFIAYIYQELLCTSFSFSNELNILSFQRTIFLFAFIYVIGILFGKLFGNWLNKKIHRLEYQTGFLITKGDKNYFDDLKEKNDKIKNEITTKFILAILTATVSVVVKYLLEHYLIKG